MYKETTPHEGFGILLEMAREKKAFFVVTSNVDGQFQKAGFDENKVLEVHGSIHHFQCNKCKAVTKASAYKDVHVDEATFQAEGEIPACKKKACQGYQLRPNILMFGDWDWIEDRSIEQSRRYDHFIQSIEQDDHIAVLEIGAGMQLPYIRTLSESIFDDKQYSHKSHLIRVNPKDTDTDLNDSQITHIQEGSLAALRAIKSHY